MQTDEVVEAHSVSVQTDIAELVPIAIPDGPQLSVPKYVVDALQQPLKVLSDWYTQQHQEAQTKIREQFS